MTVSRNECMGLVIDGIFLKLKLDALNRFESWVSAVEKNVDTVLGDLLISCYEF